MKLNLNRKGIYCLIICLYSFVSNQAQNYISYTIPSQNQLHISRNAQIIVGFNETINDSTLNNNSVVAYGSLSARHFGNIEYDTLNNQMTYTPLKNFASGERVFVSLTSEIKNISGTSLTPAYSFEFNVGSDTTYIIVCKKYQDIIGLNTIENMKVADLDIDGDFDLVLTSNPGVAQQKKIVTFMNDGEANFQQFFEYELSEYPKDLSIGDFNGDGRQDISISQDYHIKFLRTSGNGQLHDYGEVALELSGILISCDFNNDGKVDVIGLEYDYTSTPEKRKLCFIKNVGNGTFEKLYSYEFIPAFAEMQFYANLADLNNDGFMDLVILRIEENQVIFLLNNGSGIFSLLTIKYFDYTPRSFTLGDFNGDSNIDIAVSTSESGYSGLKIFRNVGNAVFVYFNSFYLHSSPWETFCTDFNNDGKMDIAITYGVGQRVGIYYGSGDLFFNSINQVWLNPSSNPYLMDFADLDGDGTVDITALNDGTNGRKLYLLLNTRPTINSVGEQQSTPTEISLSQNYPNPFNPVTKIKFAIPNVEMRHASSLQMVTLKVYDILGREVATLVNEEKPAGEYEVEFDGSTLTSGIYFYQLKTGEFIETRKMVLLK